MAESGAEKRGTEKRGLADLASAAKGGGPGGRRGPPFPIRPDMPCGDFPMRIGRDGTWYHEGTPFTRLALVKLFASVLQRASNGDFLLVTPGEQGRIAVDDAPFVAVEMQAEGSGRDQVLRFRTNVDEWVAAGPEHPIRVAVDPETDEPSPYVLARRGPEGQPGLEALIVRAVFYDLVELGEEIDGVLGVWSGGAFFPIGPVGEDA